MSYTQFNVVDFGSGRAGLTTIGYALYDPDTGLGSRVTAGIAEIIDGKFGATVTYPDDFTGALVWDSGETPAVYAVDVINPPTLSSILVELDAIRAKTDLIQLGVVKVISPVALVGNAITVRAGDSWEIPITGLGNISAVDKLYFSVNTPGAKDNHAKLLIEKTDGLLVFNSKPASDGSKGSIVVDNDTAGNIRVIVDKTVTAFLGTSADWAVKTIGSDSKAHTLSEGEFLINPFLISSVA